MQVSWMQSCGELINCKQGPCPVSFGKSEFGPDVLQLMFTSYNLVSMT